MRDAKREIPFIKPVHIGGFKMWRSKVSIGSGDSKASVEQINFSTEDGWHVKIPEGTETFILFKDLFGRNMLDAMVNYICNMYYASTVGNGYYHGALGMVARALISPELLKEGDKEHEKFVSDAKALMKGFLEWVDAARERARRNEPTDEEIRQDNIADEAMDILNKDANGKD